MAKGSKLQPYPNVRPPRPGKTARHQASYFEYDPEKARYAERSLGMYETAEAAYIAALQVLAVQHQKRSQNCLDLTVALTGTCPRCDGLTARDGTRTITCTACHTVYDLQHPQR